jgi:hypothetical protein
MIADFACINSERSLGQRKEPWIGPDAVEGFESLTGSYLAVLTREVIAKLAPDENVGKTGVLPYKANQRLAAT